jgi:triacylglycerol lipase
MVLHRLNAPVVLVHGFCGFDRFSVGGLPIAQYFPGIVEVLEKAGNRVLTPWLSPTRGVAERATELKRFLDRHAGAEPVHLVAHSMGGLDARYMISQLGMAGRVLTLTTLGTPHRGTALMDWGVRHVGALIRPVLDLVGVPVQGFYDLTTAACRAFNEKVPDAVTVRYFSVAGEFNGDPARPEWLVPYSIVLAAEGPNDGVVSVQSATWGELIATWPGDHLALVNWNNGLWPATTLYPDEGTLFARILGRLADEGF